MYLRFVRLQLRPETEREFSEFYRNRVIPALEGAPGCLFAALLRPWRGDAHKSLTLWQSPEAAHAYEEGGLFHQLLREAEPYLSSSTVWQVRLASDPLETSDPGRREIPPEGYELETDDAPLTSDDGAPVYVRIVTLKVDPDRLQEFVDLYHGEVLPALRATPGCRGALLAEGAQDATSVLSISLWDREEDAVRYELSGEFEHLTRRLEKTFSPLFGWKLSLGGGRSRHSKALDVKGFHFAVGKRLAPGDPDGSEK